MKTKVTYICSNICICKTETISTSNKYTNNENIRNSIYSNISISIIEVVYL